MGSVLESLFEKSIDLMILENEYLNHKTQRVLELLPPFGGLKVLIAHQPKNVFFAFKMNIERCFGSGISGTDIAQLIQGCLQQKQRSKQVREPQEEKIILYNEGKESFSIIHWNELVSFQKKKKQTLIYQTQKKPLTLPIAYEKVKKSNLSNILFYELIQGHTINLNHLRSITFVQSDYYHCLLSNRRIVEINGRERTRLLKFLENDL